MGLRMLRLAIGTLITGLTVSYAQDENFAERFALAENRAEALKELTPGTDESFFYHGLHYQQTGQSTPFEELLARWKDQRKGKLPPRAKELINRQALLDYEKHPRKSLDHLIEELKLSFDHQPQIADEEMVLPSTLDPEHLSSKKMLNDALAKQKGLEALSDQALHWAAGQKLNASQRHQLLTRIEHSDYPNLVKHLLAYLQEKDAKPFGELKAHRLLTLAQLDALKDALPELLNQSAFVHLYLDRLRPSDEISKEAFANDPNLRRTFLNRIWKFVEPLGPVHQPLKVATSHQLLQLDLQQNTLSHDRLMAHLKLPRVGSYLNETWQETEYFKTFPQGLRGIFGPIQCPGNDIDTITAYLRPFLIEAENTDAYAPYLRTDFLKRLFARTKLEAGVGEKTHWASLLTPQEYEALKSRVDIDFAPHNPTQFGPEDPIKIDAWIKQVPLLTINVFHVQPFNYFTTFDRTFDLGMNLEGLVPTSTQTLTYSEPSERRVLRSFDFPKLTGRGVYVIELIGNGKSSRALIIKGQLIHTENVTAAGHRFRIFNQANEQLKDASIWLDGHRYPADQRGNILIPFSTKPGEQSIILQHEDFASRARFQHQGEVYNLDQTGFYVDREALLKGEKATVAIKPQLMINGVPVPIKILEEIALNIRSTNLDGIVSTETIYDLTFVDHAETTHTFRVPEGVQSLQFELTGNVPVISKNEKQTVVAKQTFKLNGIEETDAITAIHLAYSGGKYTIEMRGKSGESRANQVIDCQFKNRYIKAVETIQFKTDKAGKVRLGALPDIEFISARPVGEKWSSFWRLAEDKTSLPTFIETTQGNTVSIPYFHGHNDLTLMEIRNNECYQQRNDALSSQNGLLQLTDLLPGRYRLILSRAHHQIDIRIRTEKDLRGKGAPAQPVHIAAVKRAKQAIEITVGNTNRYSRVHVIAHRFHPEYDVSTLLAPGTHPGRANTSRPVSSSEYSSERAIGDEYEYILARQRAQKFPGLMLERPGLLLSPWALGSTDTANENLKRTEAPTAKPLSDMKALIMMPQRHGGRVSGGNIQRHFPSLDFLAEPAVQLFNLLPEADGRIRIPLDMLKGKTQLRIVLVDPLSTAVVNFSLPDQPQTFRDLRLRQSFDAEKHLSQQSVVSIAQKGKPFTIKHIGTSTFEVYDSLEKVYQLMRTLRDAPTLTEFAFILDWPTLSPEDKQAKISTYASHELHFFLYHKDRAFFDRVIAPSLRHKKDKTFMDHYLLGNDVRRFRDSWAFNRLNTTEKILLSQRIKQDRQGIQRYLNDQQALQIVDAILWGVQFETAKGLTDLQTTTWEFRFADGDMRDFSELKAFDEGDEDFFGGEEKQKEVAHLGKLFSDFGAPSREPSAPAAPPVVASPVVIDQMLKQVDFDVEFGDDFGGGGGIAGGGNGNDAFGLSEDFLFGDMIDGRAAGRRFYVDLKQTKEWAENNYHHLPIAQQTAKLIEINAFWKDYAAQVKGPFLSRHITDPVHNFTEMMLALAVLDLPFRSQKHDSELKEQDLVITPASDVIIFHQEYREQAIEAEAAPILLSQRYFRADAPDQQDGNLRIDKPVTEEFLPHVRYFCRVTLTNPTANRRSLNALLQIPQGAIPTSKGFISRGMPVTLEPYTTQTIEYSFYFPTIGIFSHYPVHVSQNEQLLAHEKATQLNVVEKLTKIDKNAWPWVSQQASQQEVIRYLKTHNSHRVNLQDIAWRMQDKRFFAKIITLLQDQHVYHPVLWSYALKHNHLSAAQTYLRHTSLRAGPWLNTPLLNLEPVERHVYQHLEYAPLINPRAHPLDSQPRMLNQRFRGQFEKFMHLLCYKPTLDEQDRLAITYYLALQDRIPEALIWLQRVETSSIQVDYLRAWLGMFEGKLDQARGLAIKYQDYPVPRWKSRFEQIIAQLDETAGVDAPSDRNQRLEALTSVEPSIDFKLEDNEIMLTYNQVKNCTLNLYPMDIERLFSRNPFIKDESAQFTFTKAALTRKIILPQDQPTFRYPLPEQFQQQNVMIEVLSNGITRRRSSFANSLNIRIAENYGQLDAEAPNIYVKVYARMHDGRISFFKDGYTDFRGRFDYVSLNTGELSQVDRLAILIMSDTQGATIREVPPPKQ